MVQHPGIRTIGRLLMDALTADQVSELIEAIFPQGEQLDRLLENLETFDADLSATLRAITAQGDTGNEAASRQQPVTSLDRDLDLWERLWQQWEAHVLEIGDEEGAYASREGLWESPSFDGYELAFDLETVAQ